MDLSEVHAGGAGNAPILGQYLAKIILNKDATTFRNEHWKNMHSYLVDSCGIKANQSRLYFYIFSAGGGTGSGMASEFGLAQQFSYLSKTFDYRSDQSQMADKRHSFVFEPIFTSGICILPNIAGKNVEISEALHINAGRLLTKYISEEWNFSYNEEREDDEVPADVMERIRPWNSMMLISNDIMRYAEEEDGGDADNIDVNTMEKYANQYISQQIFNILTAQAVTTDYDEDYFRRAGIDIAETIRLDANDLFMSLAGPVAVAYAESVVSEGTHQDTVDIELLAVASHRLLLSLCIGIKVVQSYHNRNTKLPHIAYVAPKVVATFYNGFDVLMLQRIFSNAAVHFKRPYRGNHNCRFRFKFRFPAFDIKELFGSKISTKTRFSHHIIGQL